MMRDIPDKDLVSEIQKRLEAKDRANHDLRVMTKKLETLNQKLLESERVKSHFLSNIRNEINNPLTAVLSLCDIIMGGSNDPATVSSMVSSIHREAFSLDFQLRNIFTAAELEAGETELSISGVGSVSLITSTMAQFQYRAAEKNIRMEADLDGLSANVFRTDAEKLERLLANLISNAVEFSHSGGTVKVKAWNSEGRLNLSVSDNGIGIDPRDQEVIFERFRQLETGATKSHGGHGLGLSISRSILELMNGTVAVSSKKGEGSVFTVSIPEAQALEVSYSPGANEFFFEEEGEKF